MTSIHSQITGIKEEIKRQFSDSVDSSNLYSSNNEGGWKDLLPTVKNSPVQYRNINQASKEKYFSPNARIVENPLETAFQYRICVNCGKPIALNAIMDHLENHCERSSSVESPTNMKKEITEDDINANGKRLNSEDIPTTPSQDSKRYKENSETPQETSKRQRKVKQRNPTEKHLIDFDKQCGVELPEGGYCARSLTCKSHSMGAKRAVVGRTEPFDSLLAEYHKQHQTKIGAAAEKRAKQQKIQRQQKQIEREQKKQLQQQKQGQRKTKNNSTHSGGIKNQSASSLDKNGNNTIGANSYISLSPEEETTQVLNGVSRSFPLPLESNVLSSVRHRTKYFRMREMFASAFSIKPGYTTPGYGAIHSRVGCIDIDRTTDYKFRIRTPQPMNQLPPQGASSQQLQKLQQQRMLKAQMMQMQKDNQSQSTQSEIQQRQQAINPQFSGSSQGQQSLNNVRKTTPQQHRQENGLTPQEIQMQQQKLRQQQLQQQRFEAAAFHLANATKLMQGSNTEGASGSPESLNNVANSPSSSANQSLGSPSGGRVNVGIGTPVGGYGPK